jgi:hypothetical protein
MMKKITVLAVIASLANAQTDSNKCVDEYTEEAINEKVRSDSRVSVATNLKTVAKGLVDGVKT